MDNLLEQAQALVEEIRESIENRRERAALALLQQRRSADIIERLVQMHEGYKAGVQEDQRKLSGVASQLLDEIAKLLDAKDVRRKLGLKPLRTEADTFIEGTAPNLFRYAKLLEAMLK